MKKIKQTHGAIINEDNKSKIHECFANEEINIADKNLDKLSLEELQSMADKLGLMPVDNRNILIRSIKNALKK